MLLYISVSANFMRKISQAICIIIPTLLTSCFWGSYKNEQIVGPYFLSAPDSPDQMSIVYTEKEDYSGGGVVIDRTIYEIEWNKDFIVAKQHPSNIKRTITEIYVGHKFDSLKKTGQVTNIHLIADSLGKRKYALEEQSGRFEITKDKNKNDVTLYYLIDVKTKQYWPTLFLSQEELETAMKTLSVGHFDNRLYFDPLDRRE